MEIKLFVLFCRRRSPKKSPQKGLNDDDAEKLSQEAFRLYRTAQNLLNLKEPTLSETKPVSFHRNSLSDLKASGCAMPSYAGTSTLQRKLKLRESHNSYQSSSTSDGSVHSNSSSIRTETDEECGRNRTILIPLNMNVNRRPNNCVSSNQNKFNQMSNLPNEMDAISIRKDHIKSMASSSADDESGFSSMNSFHHEINPSTIMPPLALNSTMLSNQLSLDDDNNNKNENHHDYRPDNKSNLLPIIHKRYDSAPPLPPKAKLTTFNSLKNENSPEKSGGIHVLWV